MQDPKVNLYFVGFMGTGKSTIGRAAARRLRLDFIDSDHAIEQAQRKSISEIFATEGEPAFRVMERAFIENDKADQGVVVACGGGLVAQPGMLDLLRQRGVVICLHASLQTILDRTKAQKHRPLLNVADQAQRIAELYRAREPIYKRSGTLVLTDGRTSSDIVSHVVRIYRREAAEFSRR